MQGAVPFPAASSKAHLLLLIPNKPTIARESSVLRLPTKWVSSKQGEKFDSDAREETEIPTVRKGKLSSVCETGSKRSREEISLQESSHTGERQKHTHWTCEEGETARAVAKEQPDGDKHILKGKKSRDLVQCPGDELKVTV